MKANNLVLMIRQSDESDLKDILSVHRQAFGEEDVAGLVQNLLADASAIPLLSLIAVDSAQIVGHILFTKAKIKDHETSVLTAILAPLAVIPEHQKQGIGGKLVREGLSILAKSEIDLIFVLGHPEYYPRHGFRPAGVLGFEAPYPIPEQNADAWMVQELRTGIIGSVSGKVLCADTMDRPEYWRE